MTQGYKYPRRLRTGRPQTSTKRETNPTSGLMWVPQDEDFDETKSVRRGAAVKAAGLLRCWPLSICSVQPTARLLAFTAAVMATWSALTRDAVNPEHRRLNTKGSMVSADNVRRMTAGRLQWRRSDGPDAAARRVPAQDRRR